MFAWEDVKAMFNGGSRKRAMAASLTSVSKQQQQKRQQQQQQQQATRILMSEETGHSSPPPAYTAVKRPRHSSTSPETAADRGSHMDTKNSPSSSTSSSGSCNGVNNSHLGSQTYPFPLIPLHGNKGYGALIHGLASTPSPFSQSSMSHISSPSPPHAPPLLAAHSPPHSFKQSVATEGGHSDVRQSFAELMGSSLLLPYNYFQLSRYWPRPPVTASAPSQVLDMSSNRHTRIGFGMSAGADVLPAATSLGEKGVTGSGQVWDRGVQSQRNSLSHGVSAFKPVSKNSLSGTNSATKGSAFRAENLISGCTRSSSPGDSGHSEDEENEVDVIGGEEDMRQDRHGRRRRDSSSSPCIRHTESSSHSESFEVRPASPVLHPRFHIVFRTMIACKYRIE